MATALVVEDYEVNLNLFAMIIQLEGWTVRKCRSMREALAREEGRFYDVLVTEIDLKDGNGFTIAQQVHSRNPDAACVLIADYDVEFVRKEFRAQQLAALDWPRTRVLVKPFTAGALREAVRQVTHNADEKVTSTWQ